MGPSSIVGVHTQAFRYEYESCQRMFYRDFKHCLTKTSLLDSSIRMKELHGSLADGGGSTCDFTASCVMVSELLNCWID